MKILPCDSRHAAPILEILNDAILTSTALYDYKARTPEMMDAWLAAKQKGNYPVIGAFSDEGTLMGFGSYGAFRAWPAYKYSIEHSIYVHRDHRGKGLGRRLLTEVIEAAKQQGYHMMVGGIDSSNTVSIQLHLALGFKHCASIKEAGFKFGRWLDLEFYQLILPTPSQPVDG